MTPASGPLHGYELTHLRKGHVLIRDDSRYFMLMWLKRKPARIGRLKMVPGSLN